jgi:hypothetical protein
MKQVSASHIDDVTKQLSRMLNHESSQTTQYYLVKSESLLTGKTSQIESLSSHERVNSNGDCNHD